MQIVYVTRANANVILLGTSQFVCEADRLRGGFILHERREWEEKGRERSLANEGDV